MKTKIITLLLSTIVLQLNASEIRSVTEVSVEKSKRIFELEIPSRFGYGKITADGDVENTVGRIESSYYFDGRTILGPLDQFKFIESSSYLSLSHSYIQKDFRNLSSSLLEYYGSQFWEDRQYNESRIQGRYYKGKYYAGAGLIHSSFDDTALGRAELGLQLLENLEFGVGGTESVENEFYIRDSDEYDFSVSIRYEHTINEGSYIGVSALISENSNLSYLALKYFLKAFDQSYLANEILLTENTWKLKSSFYINEKLSISFGYTNDNDLSIIDAKYFLTNNFALSIEHSNNFGDYYISKAGIMAQF